MVIWFSSYGLFIYAATTARIKKLFLAAKEANRQSLPCFVHVLAWLEHFLSLHCSCCFWLSFFFRYVTNHPPWPPLLYLLCLSLDWYRLLSGSQWLRPAVTLWWHGMDEVGECLPFLNYHTQDTAVTHDLLIRYLCTVGDEETVRLCIARLR